MEGSVALEEENRQLKTKNSEFAEMYQHLKIQHKKLEQEKNQLFKENTILILERNRYREHVLKMKDIEKAVLDFASQSLRDIVKGADNIGNVIKCIEGHYNNNIDIDRNLTSPKRDKCPASSNNSPNNIHHVSPMIKGVTIKNPIIRVSRAVLAPTQRPVARQLENEVAFENRPELTQENDHGQIRASAIPMLGVYVSLVDNITQRQNISERQRDERLHHVRSRDTHVDNHESNFPQSAFDQQSTTENPSNEEDDMFNGDEELRNEPDLTEERNFSYLPSLDCVLEETENESSKWSNTSAKLNPFVVLDRNFEDSRSCSSPNNTVPKTNEDPLEGPSWRFDGANPGFVAVRKKKKISPDSTPGQDVLVENLQQPDSTTSASSKENSLSQTEESFNTVPDNQSTPNSAKDQQNTGNESNEINTKNGATRKRSAKSSKKLLDAKAVLTKVRRTDSIEPIPSTSTGRGSSIVSFVYSPQDDDSNSEESQSSRSSNRPRRGGQKNYKEKSLSEKLRRN